MGVIKSIAAAVGIGESPAEKARKKAERAATARTEEAARVKAKSKKEQEEAEEGKITAARKLSLIATTPQGILKEAATGRKKLLGN